MQEDLLAVSHAGMVAADRELRLRGYEVYRFGGYELMQPGVEGMLRTFFMRLLKRHEVRG